MHVATIKINFSFTSSELFSTLLGGVYFINGSVINM